MVGRGKKGSHRRRRNNQGGSRSASEDRKSDDGGAKIKRENSGNDREQRRSGYDMVSENSRETEHNGVLGLESKPNLLERPERPQ